jgi:hypothetical protein
MGGRTRKLRNRARREGWVQKDRFDSGAPPVTAPEPVKVEAKAEVKTNKKSKKKVTTQTEEL